MSKREYVLYSSHQPHCVGGAGRSKGFRSARSLYILISWGKGMVTHGMSGTKIYSRWCSIKCGNRLYATTCCSEWQEFLPFYEWAMQNGYKDELQIDRIDNKNKEYSPSNCRFITRKENCNNRDNSIHLTYRGRTQPLTRWAEDVGISRTDIFRRIAYSKWSTEKALTEPVRKRKERGHELFTFKQKTQSLKGWSGELGISFRILRERLFKLGWSTEKTFTTPIRRRRNDE